MHAAARCGQLRCLERLLLAAVVPVEATAADRCGWTPLHCAASRGEHDCLVRMLRGGAAADAAILQGGAPAALALAAHHRHALSVLALVAAGAAVTAHVTAYLRRDGGEATLEAAVRGARARAAALQPAALAAAEARVRALDTGQPLKTLRDAAATAAAGDSDLALLVAELRVWAQALAACLAARHAATAAADECFAAWRGPMLAEIAAIRQRSSILPAGWEPEKSAASARFAVAVARIIKCEAAAAAWLARVEDAASRLERERLRAEATEVLLTTTA